MHDLRRQALESRKTVSRKAKSKASSTTSSVVNSRSNSRAVSRHGSDDEEGNLSDGTNWSSNSIDDMLLVDPADDGTSSWKQALSDRIEEIVDRKRSSVQGRETSLAGFNHIMTSHYAIEIVEKSMTDLMLALLKSIKADSSERETSLALKATALALITSPSDTAYESLLPSMKRCLGSAVAPAVKASAIHALCAAAVFGGAGDNEMETLMDDLLEIVESDGASVEATDVAEVVVAACEEWGSLATYVEDLESQTETAMEAFVEQLASSDVTVQIAAGENIALLYEKSYTDREADDEPVSDEEDEDGQQVDRSYVKRYEVYKQSDQLRHTLAQLATTSTKSINKKNRKLMHSNFTDILNTVEHPSSGPRYQNAIDQETGRRYGSRLVIRINKGGSMTIDRWWKLHRLQSLRRILGAGFVVHYESNEVVFECLPIMMGTEG